MKLRPVAALLPFAPKRLRPLRAGSSLAVLAALGVLAGQAPQPAAAQGTALRPGTLPVLRGVVSGRAVVGSTARRMTIDQADPRVIIDWRSFDIGRDAQVLFRQPGSTASALNRIYDANPSVIQGRLSSTGPVVGGKATAGGQIILINQNGILFDRGAQVNAQSLVASTLNLSNDRFLSGTLTGGGLTTLAFEGGYDDTGATLALRPDGTVPAGIEIGRPTGADGAAPRLAANAGGSIVLVAPRIDHQAGVITAPDGQVLLAAGGKVYLALNDDADDITLRGFRVEIEAAGDGPGLNVTNLIRNAGTITADRGNVTLAALAVNQEGRISAKTAVQSNGSIYLTARTRDAAQSGSVSFAAGSITEVVPDTADRSTVPDAQDYDPYRGVIAVGAKTIVSAGALRAPGGRITLTASDTLDPSGARVYLDAGSELSVAGVWSDVDFAKNLRTFRVTSNELKNSPGQKNGVLRGAEVTVDLRRDSEILELDGYRGTVARTVAEKAAEGGELRIDSSGSVIQRPGARIDVSGGGYRYGAGTVTTTRLLGDDGRIYDIASAPEDRRYTALLDRYERTDARWGQTISIANPLGTIGTYSEAYDQGLAGGTLTIASAAGLVLDGTLRGGVTVGPNQIAAAPRGATLRIGEYAASQRNLVETQRIGDVVLRQQAADSLGAGFGSTSVLSDTQRVHVDLAAEQIFGASTQDGANVVETAFGSVELNVNGRIVVPEGVAVEAPVGATLTLRAPQVDIAGNIRLPSGGLTIQPLVPPAEPIAPDLPTLAERVLVRSGATLSTAGVWFNNAGPGGSVVGPLTPTGRRLPDGSGTRAAVDGGSLAVQIDDPLFQSRFERGAVLDAGSGGAIGADRRVSGGRGGSLSIANGSTNQDTSDWLQADLRGFGITRGADLSLSVARVVIADEGSNGVVPGNTTRLEADLFAERGFASFSISASDGIEIAAGTTLNVQQKNLVVDADAARHLPTGGGLASIATAQLLPDAQRGAANLMLTARGGGAAGSATLTVGEGTTIRTDPRGQVALSAVDALRVDGRIEAPGGRIGLTLNGPATLAAPALQLGAGAVLSTAGTFIAEPNDAGLVRGTLLDGGTVSVDARNAGIRFDLGSRIDVSGTSRTVEATTSDERPRRVRQTLDGHAGTLTLRAQGPVELDGTLVAHGGSAAAAGGSFALELRQPDGQVEQPDARRIVVTRSLLDPPSAEGFVDAVVRTDPLRASGFEKLRLLSEDRITFAGSATLDFERGVRLDAPLIDLADGAVVGLRGSTVSVGQSLGPRQPVSTGDLPVWTIVEGTASPVLDTRSGSGTFVVQGGTVDLYGSLTIRGAALTRIESDSDIRLVGRAVTFESQTGGVPTTRQVGGLTTAGAIELDAAQIYPATRTEFTIASRTQASGVAAPASYILVGGNDTPRGHVYSAGGSLRLEADAIVQGGTLVAPLGEIELHAARLLDLAPGSVTSVSADGRIIPYGTTQAGVTWRYNDGGVTQQAIIDAAGEGGKRIELRAARIDVRKGATVNLGGGGDVQAAEFVPGNGGDNDVTLAADTYAIVPAARLATMPYDTHTALQKDPGSGFALANGRDAVLYDSIDIGAGGAVPAGRYVLLPARYALLPDAWLVELNTSSTYRNLQPGQTAKAPNGQVVVAGFRSATGTTVRESRSVGVVVREGSAAVPQASDFNLSGAAFFADAAAVERRAAPRAPWDAGRLTIGGASALALEGTFETAAGKATEGSTARAAEIDIGGTRIAIVDRVGRTDLAADTLQISGASISALDGSVLIGGTRSDAADGIRIETTAAEVVVANDAASAVRVPELLLAATERIDVRSRSVLEAAGDAPAATAAVIAAESSGALLRLSTGAQARIDRGTAGAAAGDLRIADGATLTAARSLLVDATRSAESRGTLRAGGAGGEGGSLALSSVRVALGEVDRATAVAGGLVLSNADLAAYRNADELVLRGYSSIELVGAAAFGADSLGRLTLDTPLLRGSAAGGAAPRARIEAREIELANTAATRAAATGGSGTLTLAADRLVVAAGDKAISGFARVRLDAAGAVETDGDGTLRAAAALTIDAPRVVARGGSMQTIAAVDDGDAANPVHRPLVVGGAGQEAAADTTAGLGGRLTLEGKRIEVTTAVQATSGQITLAARGTGADDGIVLGRGAAIDTRGEVVDFKGSGVAADGGSVTLRADAGRVDLRDGARVDVSAAAQGAAGRLVVRAAALDLGGTLAGRAADGERSGSVDLDVGRLADFSALNDTLNAGGFAEERRLRLREGDFAVAAQDRVAARRVALAADSGRIDVAGTIGRSTSEGGGRVELHARDGITLASGSALVARGTAAGASGGDVRVATGGGALVFDADAVIDVRAGDAGNAGSVTFGITRAADDRLGAARLEGTVRRWSEAGLAARAAGRNGDSPATVDVEATRRYTVAGAVTSIDIDTWAADHAGFVAAADTGAVAGALRDETGALAGARLLGATEVRSAGDLAVDVPWALDTPQWLAGGRPGTLTIRAAGTLSVSQAIGNGDDGIRAGDTWNLRLAAGADLAAADSMATAGRTDAGSLRLTGPDARLRTGTGRIDIAAAGDVRMEDPAAAIYTAGRIATADAANTQFVILDRWARDGGDISVRAGGSFVGAEGDDLWVNAWLRRPRQPNNQFEELQPTDWWSYRPRFQQGIGTLGGGDIELAVDGSIERLAAMAPTSGRTWRGADGVRRVDVQGGGNLDIRAGGDIVGSAFLVGRGAGRVEAGGDIGAGRATQAYLMGVSSGKRPEQASIAFVAGGSVALQSVSNPTALFQPNRDNDDFFARDPSFGSSGSVSTFFTYSANSLASVRAKSGDLSYAAVLAPGWRTLNATPAVNSTHTDIPGAFPASLDFVAFGGDLIGPPLVDAVTTYPSPSAQVRLYAGGSLIDVGLHGSDRDPVSIVSTTNPEFANGFAARQIDGRTGLRPTATDPRIVERESTGDWVFDLQARDGSILTGGSATETVLTAPSRIRAGVDIVGAALTLQNLAEDDLTLVRADSGDFRAPLAFEIRGPGRLLLQAGRNIDLATASVAQGSAGDIGGLVATGNAANPAITSDRSARVTLVAGVPGDIDLAKMDTAYAEIVALNQRSQTIVALYRQLDTEPDADRVRDAKNIAELAADDPAYARWVVLDKQAPGALAAYQKVLRDGSLPLGSGTDATAALELYRLLNTEADVARLASAGSLEALAAGPGGERYRRFVGLDERYPRVFDDYVQRRSQGALPTALAPIVFSAALDEVVAGVVPRSAGAGAERGVNAVRAAAEPVAAAPTGNINTFRTSVQTYGGSDIDLWAPNGDIVVGLTTPNEAKTVGILTNAGGAIRSVLAGDFDINQGKVITGQGGDILVLSTAGSIDAGRGAKTSIATPPPVRRPILDESGNQIGVQVIIPASATGSGIQTLTSDPDGLGPLAAPAAGDVYLFAPAGTIDAGEAGIRSSGNIVLNAQTVLNATNISAAGSAAGVPQLQIGSLASALASSGASTAGTAKAAEEAAAAAANAARAAASTPPPKPTILSVEVLGFGEKNCKETDKDCFAK